MWSSERKFSAAVSVSADISAETDTEMSVFCSFQNFWYRPKFWLVYGPKFWPMYTHFFYKNKQKPREDLNKEKKNIMLNVLPSTFLVS